MRSKLLPLALGPLGLLAGSASAQNPVQFSVDWNSPIVGIPDCGGTPITEGDIMSPCLGVPAFGPLPVPRINISGGLGGLGLATHSLCVGHPGGTPCVVEVDAWSQGLDRLFQPNFEILPSRIWFSVDEYSGGMPGSLAPPAVWTEAPTGESSADMFANNNFMPPAPLPPFAAVPGNTGVLDGDGLPSPFVYPGVGLREPNFPNYMPAAMGDNLDAFDDGFAPASGGARPYFSLDASFTDPCTGIPNTGSALANGFVGGDVLTATGLGPAVYAPAAALGLDFFGPDTDDLDALILRDNGDGTFQPPTGLYSWTTGATDMLLFSVRRGSALIGSPDSLFGIPIEEGDILMPPVGTLSPFPSIFIAAENLGLNTLRGGMVTGGCNAGDELDALDHIAEAITDCNDNGIEDSIDIALGTSADANGNGIPDECEGPTLIADPFCFCPQTSPAPCFNFDSTAGCRNSTGPGGLLSASGSSSVVADDLILDATQLPTFQFGIFFMGDNSVGPLPFGDGLRCAGGNLCRFPIQNTGATGSMSLGTGIVNYTVVNFPIVCQIAAGSTWTFQGWYRDPGGPCGTGFNLTNAVAVTFF